MASESEQRTQNKAVLEHLRDGPITPMEALRLYGCFRLAARVYELRGAGHNILTNTIASSDGKKHYASYHLLSQAH